MRLTIETPTGVRSFTGTTVKAQSRGPSIGIHRDGQLIATFKEWTSWRIEEDGDRD